VVIARAAVDETRTTGRAAGHAVEAERRRAPAEGWRAGLPVLEGERVVLREIAVTDASSLASMVGAGQVPSFMSKLPSTREGFAEYIDWTFEERRRGRAACFAVVPAGCSQAVGLIEVGVRGGPCRPAEWTFAISP